MGGVFSQNGDFDSAGELWPALAFHAVFTALGALLVSRAAGGRDRNPAAGISPREQAA